MNYKEKLRHLNLRGKSGIYKISIASGFYIGSAVCLHSRLRSHLYNLTTGRHSNPHLQRAFDKHKDMDFEVLERVFIPELLIEREQHHMDTMSPTYNIAKVAGSQLGLKHSPETRALISRVQIGKVISQEQRLKMSEASLGKKLSESHRKHISESKIGSKNPFYKAGDRHPQFGVQRRQETKDKISKILRENGSLRGRKNPASRTGVLYDVETGRNYLFRSLKPLCRKLGIVGYGGLALAGKQERFFKRRYYLSYVDLPVGVAEGAE